MLPKPQSQSTAQNFLDIYDITNNFTILKNGTVSIVLSVGAMNFGLLAEAEQDAVIYTYAALLNSLNYPIQIIVQSQTKDVTDYLNLLKQQEESASTDLKRERIARYRQFVSNVIKERNVLDKKFFVAVPASPTELGLISADSFVPGKNSFDISSFEKSVILEKAEAVLSPKRDHLINQFARIGLFSRQLTTQEIIRIFYTSYNPEASEGQELTDTNQYTTPLVKANFINQTGESIPTQQPMQQDTQQNPTNQQLTQQVVPLDSEQQNNIETTDETPTHEEVYLTQQEQGPQIDTIASLTPTGQVPENSASTEAIAQAQNNYSQQTSNTTSTILNPNAINNSTANGTPEPILAQVETQAVQGPPVSSFSENLDDFSVNIQDNSYSQAHSQQPTTNTVTSQNTLENIPAEKSGQPETSQPSNELPSQEIVSEPAVEIKQPAPAEEDLQKTINQALQEVGETEATIAEDKSKPILEPAPTTQTNQDNGQIGVIPTIQVITPPPPQTTQKNQPEIAPPTTTPTPSFTNDNAKEVSKLTESNVDTQKTNEDKQSVTSPLPPIAEI